VEDYVVLVLRRRGRKFVTQDLGLTLLLMNHSVPYTCVFKDDLHKSILQQWVMLC